MKIKKTVEDEEMAWMLKKEERGFCEGWAMAFARDWANIRYRGGGSSRGQRRAKGLGLGEVDITGNS